MKNNRIGNSGLITSQLTLGTMLFGENTQRGTSEREAMELVNRYLGNGGNHIDTADIYAQGKAEEIIAKSISGKRNDIVISTKVRFSTSQNPNAQGLSRTHILKAVDESLTRLKTDYIDLLYVHCSDPITPLEETIRTLEQIIAQGKARYLGVSNFKSWQLMKSLGICDAIGASRFVAAQYQYSLVNRDIEYEFFDLFESEGLGLMAWGPLGGGFLTGKYAREKQPSEGRIATSANNHEESWERRNTAQNWRTLEVLSDLSKKYSCTLAQLAIAWILSKKTVASVILGARIPEQLTETMASPKIEIAKEDVQELDTISKLPELYPYRMIAAYGMRTI